MPVVNANSVTFSGKTKLKIALFGVARAALPNLGLIQQGSTFNFEQTLREKRDFFPEVIVAQAIQAQNGTLETRLREWRKETIGLALGLNNTLDMTEVAGGDVAVVNEAVTLNSNDLAALRFPRKISVAPVVTNVGGSTTFVAGTDYRVIDRDLEGRTLIQRIAGGAITAGQQLEVDYTYVSANTQSWKVGKVAQVRYFSAELEEELTNGGKRLVYVPKCTISLAGALNFAAVDDGAELPIRLAAVQDSALDYLALMENIEP